jgi:hypothetical protein
MPSSCVLIYVSCSFYVQADLPDDCVLMENEKRIVVPAKYTPEMVEAVHGCRHRQREATRRIIKAWYLQVPGATALLDEVARGSAEHVCIGRKRGRRGTSCCPERRRS